MKMRIRMARPGEAESLTSLCIRSKAHWGYDATFMTLSAATLKVKEEDIAGGRVVVAIDDTDGMLGVASVMTEGDSADLDSLFVEPSAIGSGAGRALFDAAVDLARRQGARRVTILADPHAATFYERMGAHFLRHAPSDAVPGRTLPLYEYDLVVRAGPVAGLHGMSA